MLVLGFATSCTLVYIAAYWALGRLPVDSLPVRTLAMVQAYRQLGMSGPRCARHPLTTYDPGSGSPDPVLVANPPEEIVAVTLAGHDFVVEQVQVYHRAAHAMARVRFRDGNGHEEVHRLTLIAGRARAVSLSLPQGPLLICYAGAGDWQIVKDERAPVS